MKHTFLAHITLLFLLPSLAFGQDEDIEGTRLFYRTDQSGSLLAHTNGFGLNYRYSKRITGFKKTIWAIEGVNMKHAKEQKSYNPYYEDTKGFIYGKMNWVAMLRPSWGRERTLFSKEVKRGVAINTVWLIGPTLAFAKPVYLEIAYPGVPNYESISTEKYNPDEHSIDRIFGRASGMRGVEESTIHPGVHAKFGLNFEYAPADDKLKAIETGITIDAFPKEVPIMAIAKNPQVFATLYVHIQWGKKKF